MRRLVFVSAVSLRCWPPCRSWRTPSLFAVPAQPGYATNPPVADSPLQQQIMRNYRTDLQQAQRELAVQNPSGLSREQLDVTHQLNTVNSDADPVPPAAPMAPAAPPAVPGRRRAPAPLR